MLTPHPFPLTTLFIISLQTKDRKEKNEKRVYYTYPATIGIQVHVYNNMLKK